VGYPAKKALKEVSVAIVFVFIAFAARWLDFFYYNSPDKPGSLIFSKLVGSLLVVLAVSILNLKWEEIGFTKKNFLKYLYYGLILLFVYIFLFYFLKPYLFYLFKFSIPEFSLSFSFPYYDRNYILELSMLTLNMVCEEGLFRGILQTRLKKIVPNFYAILIQSILFGLWHVPWALYNNQGFFSFYNLNYFLYTFGFGIIVGYIFEWTGTLTIPIIIHFFAGDNPFSISFFRDEIENITSVRDGVITFAISLTMFAIFLLISYTLLKKKVIIKKRK